MPMKKPIHFKFRARSSTDVQKAVALLADRAEVRWLSEHRGRQFPGCTVRLGRTRMGLRAVRHWLAKVPDAPMMYQTLALEADYTGEPIFKSIAQVAEADRQSEAWKPDPAFRHYARHEDAITRLTSMMRSPFFPERTRQAVLIGGPLGRLVRVLTITSFRFPSDLCETTTRLSPL